MGSERLGSPALAVGAGTRQPGKGGRGWVETHLGWDGRGRICCRGLLLCPEPPPSVVRPSIRPSIRLTPGPPASHA